MMKSKVLLLVVSLLFIIVCPGFVSAAVFDDGGGTLQAILDGATVGGSSSVDVTTDRLSDASDSYWEIGAAGGSIASLLFEAMPPVGSPGTFGVYSGSQYVELLDLTSMSGQQVLLSIDAAGNVYKNFSPTGVTFGGNEFGYYFDAWDSMWHSDTDLNPGGSDRMVAYQGNDVDQVQIGSWAPGTWGANEYVLAWEDDVDGNEMNYDDFVIMVESVKPIPEPATMLLLGLGGLILHKRKSSGE